MTKGAPEQPRSLVFLTGVSGSGRSTALNTLEDIGYRAIGSLPPALFPAFADFLLGRGDFAALPSFPEPVSSQLSGNCSDSSSSVATRFALHVDVLDSTDIAFVDAALGELKNNGVKVGILFLDCSNDEVARRYQETRRPHPLEHMHRVGAGLRELLDSERTMLAPFRLKADEIIDTSSFSPHDLRRRIEEFAGEYHGMRVQVVSFGFKYGIPRDVDLLVDVRFLPNPHFVPELRPGTGRDVAVASFVFASGEAAEFITRYRDLLLFLLPRYRAEGKSYLTIGVGCTGGRHRSVAVSERLAAEISGLADDIRVLHRDS
ncbi:MAG: RNase adapter RapZ [bacterium]|nr:RNase adapter RapZ [bacterium]